MKTVPAAGAANVLRLPAALAAEEPPEITSISLFQRPSICQAPQLIVGDLLRTVAITAIGSSDHLFVSVMAAHIGLDPAGGYSLDNQRFFLAGEPVCRQQDRRLSQAAARAQDLRARHVGHLVVNSSIDKPWSQYFSACWPATETSSARTRLRPSA